MPEHVDPRDRILATVAETPGVHFNELVRRANLATGQVQYHVYDLLDEGELSDENLYGRTHYFGGGEGFTEEDRRRIAVLRRDTSRAVVVHLLEEGECRPGDVADELDIARSTLEWHLARLEEQGLVEKSYEGSNRVEVSVADEEEVIDCLASVSPSVAERLADGLMLLVDDLFEGGR